MNTKGSSKSECHKEEQIYDNQWKKDIMHNTRQKQMLKKVKVKSKTRNHKLMKPAESLLCINNGAIYEFYF